MRKVTGDSRAYIVKAGVPRAGMMSLATPKDHFTKDTILGRCPWQCPSARIGVISSQFYPLQHFLFVLPDIKSFAEVFVEPSPHFVLWQHSP
jgi:hypothetical protein